MTVSSLRALVVDDSATIRNFVTATLEHAGYEVSTAKSGLEALKILPTASFHLVVTDVNMPDINGLIWCALFATAPRTRARRLSSSAPTEESVTATVAWHWVRRPTWSSRFRRRH